MSVMTYFKIKLFQVDVQKKFNGYVFLAHSISLTLLCENYWTVFALSGIFETELKLEYIIDNIV